MLIECWKSVGCDAVTREECPFSDEGMLCPMSCDQAFCTRGSLNAQTSEAHLLTDPTIDRSGCVKKICMACTFFLEHAPRIAG